MYYVPALIEGLYYVRDLLENDEVHLIESNIWYQSLAKRLEVLGKDIGQLNQEENIPNLAMQILDNVNERALVSIARIFGIEEEGEAEE